jgi:hypothetical protein
MEMQNMPKMRKHGNAKVENAETWKCKMYFVMSRLGHRTPESESRSDEIERAAKRRARCKKGGRDGLGSPAMFQIRIIILSGIMLIDNNIIPTLC